jgi:hypothetical protein
MTKCFEIAQLRNPIAARGETQAIETGVYANSKGQTLFSMEEAMKMAHDLCKETGLTQLVRYSNR